MGDQEKARALCGLCSDKSGCGQREVEDHEIRRGSRCQGNRGNKRSVKIRNQIEREMADRKSADEPPNQICRQNRDEPEQEPDMVITYP